ncbi:ABC transporter ATP-binding protein [Microbacterium pseudoresistens]|uniref:NitT/TauT family transport system ATP-binding protein n=2 Tax=Microbacterium pseudoresistens TaxID=640634 RepID=A0A7Y9JNT3_9MICO|nr:ABC transporter ATP-binding protein [Microbacterium pseudoresistens]NYD54878.1 NitT/TauT family transport system ATP-binding protein [Microbacterium pseudoresistens]
MSSVILKAKGLSKSFRMTTGDHHVLKDVDLQIERGSFTSIIGPSGCGKSSLLMCLSGLSKPTSGVVEIDGREVTSPPEEATYLFQQYSKSVFPWRTVRENAEFGMEVSGVPRKTRRERSANILDRVGLAKFADRYPSELSGGMQQRLAIARALVCEPQVLLMDEPFSAVDALTRAQLQDLVLDIWEEAGLTIIFVTHDVEEAVYLSDRVISLGRDAAGIQLDVEVDLARPRNQISTRESAEFMSYRHELLDLVLSDHHPDGSA